MFELTDYNPLRCISVLPLIPRILSNIKSPIINASLKYGGHSEFSKVLPEKYKQVLLRWKSFENRPHEEL